MGKRLRSRAIKRIGGNRRHTLVCCRRGMFDREMEDGCCRGGRRRAGGPARRGRGRRAGAPRRGVGARAPAAGVAVYRRDDLPRGNAAGDARAVARRRSRERRHAASARRTRSAPAVALSPGCADPTGPKALRASMGSIFRVPVAASRSRRDGGWRSFPGRRAAAGGGSLRRGRVRARSGTRGLPEEVLARCDVRATIPRRGGGIAQRRDGRDGGAVRAAPTLVGGAVSAWGSAPAATRFETRWRESPKKDLKSPTR